MFDKPQRAFDLDDAYFPVEMRNVFAEPCHHQNEPLPLPRHAAIVDVERKHVFAVVTSGYRLVTNMEAVDIGAEIMERVFGHIKIRDMQCFNVIMPETRSFCHIDLVYADSEFEPFTGDQWSPFLRVTNSYNRTKKLRFELGFCRWICRNGMIFGARSIEISDAHSHSGLNRIRYDQIVGDLGDIRAHEARFMGQLQNLKRYHVPPHLMPALFCRAFHIKVPTELEATPRRLELLAGMARKLSDLTEEYFESMGHHAYAALNVLTDFASRPEGVISAASSTHGYQVESSRWMEDFISAISNASFDFDRYLGEARLHGERLMLLRPKVEAQTFCP